MTNYRRRLDLARKTLCLSCCKEMEHGFCQACWEQQGRAYREGRCGCGQWRDQSAGPCECGAEKR